MLLRSVILVALLWPVSALAQDPGSAPNVNDCTFFQDPERLRECIDGARVGLRTGRAIGALPPNPEVTGSVGPRPLAKNELEAAGGSRVGRNGKPGKAVRVEQVAPRERKR